MTGIDHEQFEQDVIRADQDRLASECADAELVEAEVVPDENPYAMVPVLPGTGEVLRLANLDDPQLAQLLDQIRQWEREELRVFKRQVQDEILHRLDRAANWTLHTDGWDVSAPSPEQVEYDVDQLRIALKQLQVEGLIDADAAKGAIRVKIEYEAAKSGINRLLKLGGRVAEAVKACQRRSEKPRNVTLKAKTNPTPGGTP